MIVQIVIKDYCLNNYLGHSAFRIYSFHAAEPIFWGCDQNHSRITPKFDLWRRKCVQCSHYFEFFLLLKAHLFYPAGHCESVFFLI